MIECFLSGQFFPSSIAKSERNKQEWTEKRRLMRIAKLQATQYARTREKIPKIKETQQEKDFIYLSLRICICRRKSQTLLFTQRSFDKYLYLMQVIILVCI